MGAGQAKFPRYQIIFVAAWLVLSSGMTIQRTLSVDPELADGHKCIILTTDTEQLLKLNGLPKNADPFELLASATPITECSKASLQAIIDLRLHLVASIAGSLVPTIILAPVIYLLVDWLCRRYNARFKICEHCAERIKSAAKVCRYCGRSTCNSGTI
jgi:hypothetical protein